MLDTFASCTTTLCLCNLFKELFLSAIGLAAIAVFPKSECKGNEFLYNHQIFLRKNAYFNHIFLFYLQNKVFKRVYTLLL